LETVWGKFFKNIRKKQKNPQNIAKMLDEKEKNVV